MAPPQLSGFLIHSQYSWLGFPRIPKNKKDLLVRNILLKYFRKLVKIEGLLNLGISTEN